MLTMPLNAVFSLLSFFFTKQVSEMRAEIKQLKEQLQDKDREASV